MFEVGVSLVGFCTIVVAECVLIVGCDEVISFKEVFVGQDSDTLGR